MFRRRATASLVCFGGGGANTSFAPRNVSLSLPVPVVVSYSYTSSSTRFRVVLVWSLRPSTGGAAIVYSWYARCASYVSYGWKWCAALVGPAMCNVSVSASRQHALWSCRPIPRQRQFASILRPLGPSPGGLDSHFGSPSQTKLKINHLRSSPEPPELAGSTSTAIAAAPDTPSVAYIIIGHQHEDPQRAAPHAPRTAL